MIGDNMETGKRIRLRRIYKEQKRNMLIVPLDHGVTMWPIKGMGNMGEIINVLARHDVDAIILHKGMIYQFREELINSHIPLIMQLSAGTQYNNIKGGKVSVGSVKEAIAFGCDAVAIQVPLNTDNEKIALSEMGMIAEQCYKYGMPLLAMMYINDRNGISEEQDEVNEHVVRIATEIGADIVKIKYTTSESAYKSIFQHSPIPVIMAGGNKIPEADYLKNAKNVIELGAKGIAVGRNIFQSEHMDYMLNELDKIIHS